MRNLNIMFVVASALVLTLAACGGSASNASDSTADTGSPDASDGTDGSSAVNGSNGSSGSNGSPGSGPGDGGSSPVGIDGSAGATGPCGPYLGNWVATLDMGTGATGTDLALVGGTATLTGTINFTLTADASVPNTVDFSGTATIMTLGQTLTAPILPLPVAAPPAQGVKCDGGLHIQSAANLPLVGNVIFTVDGMFDTTTTPVSGTGTFTTKTADDDGGALSATGKLHIVKQ